MSSVIATTHYHNLISRLQTTIKIGLIDAQKALEYQRLKTYWEIGRSIRKTVDASKGALQCGMKLYERIGEDIEKHLQLEISPDTIQRTVQFYKNYPAFPAKTTLNFTQYMALQRLHDPKKRQKLEQEAMRKDLSALEIKARILGLQSQGLKPAEKMTPVLNCERGEPYVYSIRNYADITDDKRLYIDCGFNITLPANKYYPLIKRARIMRVLKTEDTFRFQQIKEKNPPLYTYAAKVLKVIDGDTLDVHIDVGFGIWLKERIRLKGINAPEMKTSAGQKSKLYLMKTLLRCPIIVMRTEKAGMYGRWLADVFVFPKCGDPKRIACEGEFLNQKLIDEGLAEIY